MPDLPEKRITRRQLIKMASLAAGGIVVSPIIEACASPQASPTPKPTSPPAAATKAGATPVAAAVKPASQQPLKIGILAPYSGVYAKPGESLTNATLLAFEQAGMMAGGRKIEVIKEDTEVKPDVGLRKIRKLVEQDNVDIVTGIISSAVALAVRDYVDQNKIPLVISNAGAVDLSRAKKSRYIVRASFSNWQWNWAIGPWVYQNLAKEVLLAGSDYAAGHEHVEGFAESFTKAGGKIIDRIWPPFPNVDYGPYLSKIQSVNPPLVYAFFAGTDGLNFIKQYKEFGLKGKIKLAGSGSTVDDDILQAQGDAAVGFINGHDYAISLDNPENKKFKSDFQAKFKQPTDGYAARGYDAGKLIVEAVNKVQGNTSDKLKVIDAMVATKFNGPRGPFSIDPETQNVILDCYLREVKMVDGKPDNIVFDVVKGVKDPGK